MSTQIALLRAINVGGRNRLAMSALRELAESLGFSDVKTLLQSGNLVLNGGRQTGAALETLLETETEDQLDVSVDYLVRSAKEWRAIVAANPFSAEAKRDPGHLVMMCLKLAPTAKAVQALRAAIKGRETIRAAGKQLYIVYPDGLGRSKLTGTLIEQQLDTRGTARNWNTVLKLAELTQT